MTKFSAGDHTVPMKGFFLSYHVAGDGPLLFVTSPGLGIGSRYLQQGLAPLYAHFKIICIDTRGSGKSSRPPDLEDMSSAVMADDIDALRQYLGLETIDLMGHSNGGAITIAYAQRHPSHLRKMVLIDSQLIGFDGSEATATFLKAAAEDPRYREAVLFVAQPTPTTDEGFNTFLMGVLPLYFYDPKRALPVFVEAMEGGMIPAVIVHAQQAADCRPGSDQVTCLADIRARTLIIVGRHDWICPVVVSEKLHQGIPQSQLSIFKSTGHMPWIEEPERFTAEVVAFLKSA